MNDRPKENLDCTDIKALLSALIDDRIDAESRYRAERHLGECNACRELVSEAELNEALIAAQGRPDSGNTELPEGFEVAVLSRTVFAKGVQENGSAARRWTSWLGWLAAAAALFLAVSIWRLEQRAPSPGPDSDQNGAVVQAAAWPEVSSWTLKSEVAPYVLDQLQGGPTPNEVEPLVGDVGVVAAPPAPRMLISREDAETLDATALLLALLEERRAHDFSDIEQARRIIEYDDLLPRLAHVRRHVSFEDQPLILAAESVMYRVARGPLSLDDVRELRESVVRMELSGQLDTIRNQPLLRPEA